MKLPIAIAFSAALIGCATPAELRKKEPDLQTSSTKSAKSVAMCLTDKWENSTTASMRETPQGYAVTVLCGPNTCLLSDISSAGSGSRTKVYTNGMGTQGFVNDAKACQ